MGKLMATTLDTVTIGGADRSAYAVRAEAWRTINGVGRWEAVLRNPSGVLTGLFDVQDQFLLNVDGPGNTLMQGRVDGPAVETIGQDGEDDWDLFMVVRGVDQAQDLLFHNDFEYLYPNPNQQIKTVLNDIFNIQLIGLTNITYAMPGGGTPVAGAIEFREGTNFLATLQELCKSAGYIFYVDDVLAFRSGQPGFPGSWSGVTIRSSVPSNVIGSATVKERDGDKLYNYIKLYGKNPQFDAWTEYNASTWQISAGGGVITDDTMTIAPFLGNQASIRASIFAAPGGPNLDPQLDFRAIGNARTDFHYNSLDLSKGEIGFWAYYDGAHTAAQAPIRVRLTDNIGTNINFYSGPVGIITSNINRTRLYRDLWGWCSVPIGKDVQLGGVATPDRWWPLPAADFNWSEVRRIVFTYEATGTNRPSNLYIDGLTLPVPPIAVSQDAASQAAYRIRPFIDNRPNVRTQNGLDALADQILDQHKNTDIDLIEVTTTGTANLRYPTQTITVDLPELGVATQLCYITELHHIIEPHVDVSGGYGHDWITRVTAVPVGSTAYDLQRLGRGSTYSPSNLSYRDGTALRVK